MSISLIKDAQIATKLTIEQLETANEIKKILGRTHIAEVSDMVTNEISKSDYNEWMKQIHQSAEEQSININSKPKFEDLAFEVLDNDPKLDILGNNEKVKQNITNTLWHAHHASMGHEKVTKASASAMKTQAKKAKEEEEMGKAPGYEDEEKVTTSKPSKSSGMNWVAKEGYEAGFRDAQKVKPNSTKCKYAPGSMRATLWKEAYKHGLTDGSKSKTSNKGSNSAEENEEVDGSKQMDKLINGCEREGFAACAKAFQGDNNFSKKETPYPAGSAKAAAYEHGWKRFTDQIHNVGDE